jgi:beta-glucosidase
MEANRFFRQGADAEAEIHRVYSLQALHSGQVDHFSSADGFGNSRLIGPRPKFAPEYVEYASAPPVDVEPSAPLSGEFGTSRPLSLPPTVVASRTDPYRLPSIDVLASSEHRALAREAATKAIVLLRNEPVDGTPVLPMDPAALGSVAVVGRLAAIRNLGDGGSSDVWAPSAVTPLDGLRAALPGVDVRHSDDDASIATGADVAVVVVGYEGGQGEFVGDSGTATCAHAAATSRGRRRLPQARRRRRSTTSSRRPTSRQWQVQLRQGGDRASLWPRRGRGAHRRSGRRNPRTVVAWWPAAPC